MIRAPEIKLFNYWLVSKCLGNRGRSQCSATFDPWDVMCAVCDNFGQCLCVSAWMKPEVWPSSLIVDRGSSIGCHHSSMTRLWQQGCVHSVLPGFAYIQSGVVACQTKWRQICIVVSLLVPFTRPAPLPSPFQPRSTWSILILVFWIHRLDWFHISLWCDILFKWKMKRQCLSQC